MLNIIKNIFTSNNNELKENIDNKDLSDQKWMETIEKIESAEHESLNKSTVQEEEKELIVNLLNLRNMDAQDVMIPRADIIGVPLNVKQTDLLAIMANSKLSKLPVYNENLDDVLGIVNLHDIFVWQLSGKLFDIKSLIKPVLFVSPSMRSFDLLFKMREKGADMAFVVDEFGGIDGLVCFSDIIEEIIGEIQHTSSESDRLKLFKRTDGVIIADARVHLEEFKQRFGVDLTQEIVDIDLDEVETVGGLIAFLVNRVPTPGEKILSPQGMEFEILDADPRKVKRVSITINPKSSKNV